MKKKSNNLTKDEVTFIETFRTLTEKMSTNHSAFILNHLSSDTRKSVIIELYQSGVKVKDIASLFGIKPSTVYSYTNKEMKREK